MIGRDPTRIATEIVHKGARIEIADAAAVITPERMQKMKIELEQRATGRAANSAGE